MLRCVVVCKKNKHTTTVHDARTQQGFVKIYSQFYVMSFTCITFSGFVCSFVCVNFFSLVFWCVMSSNSSIFFANVIFFVTWIEKRCVVCMCESDGNAFNFWVNCYHFSFNRPNISKQQHTLFARWLAILAAFFGVVETARRGKRTIEFSL